MTWKHIEQVAAHFGYTQRTNTTRVIFEKIVEAGALDLDDNNGVFDNTPVQLSLECVHGKMLLTSFILDTQDESVYDVNTEVGDDFLHKSAGHKQPARRATTKRRRTKVASHEG